MSGGCVDAARSRFEGDMITENNNRFFIKQRMAAFKSIEFAAFELGKDLVKRNS